MIILAFFAAMLIFPSTIHSASFPSEGSYACVFEQEDFQMLEGLLTRSSNIETFTAKFANCRFVPRHPVDLILIALQATLLRHMMDLYQFLIERTHLDGAMKDGFFSNLLVLDLGMAFGGDNMD